MTRKWEVAAVYQPLPREITRWERHGAVKEIVLPPGGGIEFKLYALGYEDGLAAIEAVKRSGFFCGDFAKQFGFVAIEQFHSESADEVLRTDDGRDREAERRRAGSGWSGTEGTGPQQEALTPER